MTVATTATDRTRHAGAGTRQPWPEADRPSASATPQPAPLAWGWHGVVVPPDHFRVAYVINPHMDPARQPDPRRAREQWQQWVATLRAHGVRVDVAPARADAPDMVYAMNLGLALRDGDRRRVLMSHMRHPERRVETPSATAFFAGLGYAPVSLGRDGVGPHLEAGDAFPFGDALVVGYGPRTEEPALTHLAAELGVRVRGLHLTHPGMYHLDLAFAPLDSRSAMVCPDAFDEASARAALALVPDPLVLSEEEALTFAANCVVVGRTVFLPTGVPARVHAWLRERDFTVREQDVSELHRGGGSLRCLTNPVDLVLGRDLPAVPGGELVLP